MTTILLTGFERFSSFHENPSQKALEVLSAERIAGVQLYSLVLPVAFKKATRELKTALHLLKPEYICMLGFSASATGIEIERRALRLSQDSKIPKADYLLADNDHESIYEQRFPSGPPVLKTTWPNTTMMRIADSSRIPASLSNDPGNYVCNFALYGLLHEILTSCARTRAGFIHLAHFDDSVAGFLGKAIASIASPDSRLRHL